MSKFARQNHARMRDSMAAIERLRDRGLILKDGMNIALTDAGIRDALTELITGYAEAVIQDFDGETITEEQYSVFLDTAEKQGILTRQEGYEVTITEKGKRILMAHLIRQEVFSTVK